MHRRSFCNALLLGASAYALNVAGAWAMDFEITKDEYDQRADEHAERLQTYPGADYTEKMRAWVAEEIREALRTGNDITPTVRIYRGEEAARRGRALIESAVSAEELAELDARTAPDNSTDS